MKRLTLEEMQKIAEERGGKCLSDTYINQKTKLLWECAKGHQWKATPSDIRQGCWCPYCAGKMKGTLAEMQQIAEERGGKCLSNSYVNSQTKLLWECAKGHQWKAVPNSIKNGRWCPYCAGKVKGTLEDMQRIATKQGGKCLSETYVNGKTKLLWQCVEGHQWKATPNSIKRGSWCPHCGGNIKGTLDEMKQIAEEQGGKCLSESYINNRKKLLWECVEGHQWEARPGDIKRGQWCPFCAGNVKLTIADMQRIANERGGKCLSGTYVNANTRLVWECAEGHQWEATPGRIKSGAWCPYCAGNVRLTIADMQRIANERGGKCLSKSYVNNHTKLLWQCAEGHQWEAKPNTIINGHWCPYCVGLAKGTIEEMQCIAEERGGKCLSESYINDGTKLLWECAEGHQWETTPNNVKSGSWCPECSSGLGERICRAFFEQFFERKFPKSYPRWLVNQKGNQMELDGYCKSLGLAFEHHGRQHYSTENPFITTEKALRERQENDKLKRELCEQQGIILIEIPEIPALLPIEEVKAFIKNEYDRYRIPFPLGFDTKRVNLKSAYATSSSKEVLKELQSIAKEQGGKCLSENYINNSTKLLWECAEGHQWKATPDSIKRGSWCPNCANKKHAEASKLDIVEMQRLAAERGGKCLSKNYIHAHSKLLWECAEGHQWEATPVSIKNGHWCPHCAGVAKGTITDIQRIAEERGGRCLSKTYINNRTKLLWQCAEGHQWEATSHSIKRGRWCPVCANKRSAEARKLGIAAMHKIAKERGGKCLSKTYFNSKTKLLWECAKGHQWKATPNMIKRGRWCPVCTRLKKQTKT